MLIASSSFQTGGTGVSSHCDSAVPFKTASIIKPLLAWAAASLEPYASDPKTWQALMRAAIETSSNDAATELWNAADPATLLIRLSDLTDEAWTVNANHPTWGSTVTTSFQMASAYRALFTAASIEPVQQIIRSMGLVNESQTLGIRGHIHEFFSRASIMPAIKCGWRIDRDITALLTHMIVALPTHDGWTGLIILSQVELTTDQIARYDSFNDNNELAIPMHRELMDEALVAELDWWLASLDPDALI